MEDTITREAWMAKHGIPADFDSADIVAWLKDKGQDQSPAFTELLEHGTYRGVSWQGTEADVGISGGYFEEIEFEGYPEWMDEIFNECDGEFLSTLHEKEAEGHQEDDRW